MQFIRENMFYVVLVAAVVVGGAVILAVGAGVGGGADTALENRRALDRTLLGLERGQPITQGTADAEKARVAAVEAQTKKVDAVTLTWSRGDCPVFEKKDAKDGQSLPAFRPDPPLGGAMTKEKLVKWKKDNAEALHDAYMDHTGVCVAMMRSLILEDRRSTTPPTPGMISRERDGRLPRLKSERAEKERLETNRLKQPGVGAAAAGRGDDRRIVHMPGTRLDSVEAQAEADARAQLAVTQSENGYIYADLWALHPVYTENEILLAGGRTKLWGAWVQYMICRDIVAAIRETIVEDLKAKNPDPAKGTVAGEGQLPPAAERPGARPRRPA
ncbi:MAG: hypothetical protein NTV86_21090 [Planctomycetota bacterium]|nr:hypothetical protein [Planctomycetota bacterium]